MVEKDAIMCVVNTKDVGRSCVVMKRCNTSPGDGSKGKVSFVHCFSFSFQFLPNFFSTLKFSDFSLKTEIL